jgi:hypothetical protein
MADDRAAARREAATLLGVDVEHLSPADNLRVDMVSSLRLVIDHEQANVLSGNSADLGKLNVAVQSLIALLPGHELPEPKPADGGPNDPRTIMWENYLAARRRGEIADPTSTFEGRMAEIERLKAELASKDARIAELEAALAGSVPLPPNAVKLRNDNPGRPAAPAAPPTPTPPASAAASGYDYNREDGWKSYVEPTGEIRSTPRGRWDV